MKAIDMTDEAEKGLAELMVKGLAEFNGRAKPQLSCLELLALTATRMLVGAGALDIKKLTERGLEVLSENPSVRTESLTYARENMAVVYDNEADLALVGIKVHTVQ